LHFFLVDIVIILEVPVILIIDIGIRRVVTEAFFTACALVVVAVGVLEVDASAANHCYFFWYGRDKKVVSSDRSVL